MARRLLVVQPETGLEEAPEAPATVVEQRLPGKIHVLEPVKRRVRLATLPAILPVLRVLTVREFKSRYKQTALGPIWLLVQPLGTLAAFTVVFDGAVQVDTSGIAYPLFALTGLCVWSFFQLVLTNGIGSILTNKSLVRRVASPRVAFPLVGAVVQMPVLLATITLTFVGVFTIGDGLSVQALALPFGILWLFLLTWGLLSALSALTVRFRDVGVVVPLITQAGVFLTPVGYPLPDYSTLATLAFSLNPLTGVIEFWRWCLLPGFQPEVLAMAVSLPMTVVLVVAGWWIFSRLEVDFADYV